MNTYSAANFSDAMEKMNTMDASIQNMTLGLKVFGPAYTVNCYPGGIITCHKALGEVPSGSVLVVNGSGDPNGALWGELTTLEAMNRGVKGIVIDGAVRDIGRIKELGFPVFAKYVTPRVGSNKTVGTTGEEIVCGGVTVRTGDLIVGDDDGVVVLPKEKINKIMEIAKKVEEKEKTLLEKVVQGFHIADLIGMSKIIKETEVLKDKQK